MKLKFTLFCFVLSVNSLWAQKLEEASLIDNITAQEISALIGIPIAYDVDLYKLRYHTPDVNGNDHIASGLLCVPVSQTIVFPLACYQHGTVDGREDVPSRLAGGYELPLLLAALGYVTCAPDFIGLGDSPGIHPYVHSETEASAGVDMLFAVREMAGSDEFPDIRIHDQLFVGGYSQGGHASMALHRVLEEQYSDEFQVTAAAHMSGPYSISEKMIEFTLGDEEYGTVAYLAWVILSYKEAYADMLEDIELEDVFKTEYLDNILRFKNEEIGLFTLNDILSQQLIQEVGGVFPREMVRPAILDSLLNNPDYILNHILRLNDTFDWAPEAPTNLYYCRGDEQVTFENAILAEEVMLENGSNNIRAIQRDGLFPLSHTQCVAPVISAVNFFFDSYNQLLSSNSNIALDRNIKMHYYADQMYTEIPREYEGDDFVMKVFSLEGREVLSKAIDKGIAVHELNLPMSGMYVTTILNNKGIIANQKFIKP